MMLEADQAYLCENFPAMPANRTSALAGTSSGSHSNHEGGRYMARATQAYLRDSSPGNDTETAALLDPLS
jgi:hypothetical protein